MTQRNPNAADSPLFKLEYPQSVGIFNSYAEAQKAVDSLADQDFPVRNLAIVGTDLKLVERVTGRRTWGTVLSEGVANGLMTGFIVALFMLFLSPGDVLVQLLTALVIGIGVGLLFATVGYLLSRGRRDFTSITQTVATKYEILCEHKVAAKARELLSATMRKAAFAPATGSAPAGGVPPTPWPGQPGQAYGPPQQPWQAPPPGYGYPPPPAGSPGMGVPAPGPDGAAQPWVPPTGSAGPTPQDEGRKPTPEDS